MIMPINAEQGSLGPRAEGFGAVVPENPMGFCDILHEGLME